MSEQEIREAVQRQFPGSVLVESNPCVGRPGWRQHVYRVPRVTLAGTDAEVWTFHAVVSREGGATVAPPVPKKIMSWAFEEIATEYKSLAALAPHGEADHWLQERARENGLSLIERITGPDGMIAWYFGHPAGSSCMAISREDLTRGRDEAGVLAIVAVRFRDMLAEVRGATVAPRVPSNAKPGDIVEDRP